MNENIKRPQLSELELLGHQKRVIEKPSESLSPEEKGKLAKALLPLAANGFMREPDAVLYEDVYVHLFECDRLTVVVDKENQPQAFVAVSLGEHEGDKVYHLEGVIVASERQKNGYARGLLLEDIIETGANILAFHTQSKSMLRVGEKLAESDNDLALRALMFSSSDVRVLNNGMVIDKGRYARRYGGSLYGDKERFRSQAIEMPGFDYREGDAVMFAGRVNKGGRE